MKLIGFELRKLWGKRGFCLSFCVILLLNVLLLWYAHLPDQNTPPLSAYQAFAEDMAEMTETEKGDYLAMLQETLDGVDFAQKVVNARLLENGDQIANAAMERRPGVFERYYDQLTSGDYLIYTDSLSLEQALVKQMAEEYAQVSGYGDYLNAIQENRDTLGSISLFQDSTQSSFSSRNIQKSARDYAGLEDSNIRWIPSQGIANAMDSILTDLLLLLTLFLFVGGSILEEKEKHLFYITRATHLGGLPTMGAKLLALLIHCLSATAVLYGCNLLFFACTTGLGDLSAGLQSLAPYLSSPLPLSIWAYLLLSLAMKALALYGAGALLTALCVCVKRGFVPYLAGIGAVGISWLFYALIPAYSMWSPLKFLNLIGLLRTETLLGGYWNFNILGTPVSRLTLATGLLMAGCVLGSLLSLLAFGRGHALTLRSSHATLAMPFHPHGNLLRHEGYKLLLTNRALVILLAFALLLGYQIFHQGYSCGGQEQYYQTFLLQLEGEWTEEKEQLLATEQARYDTAFAELERIESLVSEGTLEGDTAEVMKGPWYSETVYYPAFQRILLQYDRVKAEGGDFVYDTGYLYLFGIRDGDFPLHLLLLTLAIGFAFSNAVSMEYQAGAWPLLQATQRGRRAILRRKGLVTLLCAWLLTLAPWVCRWIAITRVFPLGQLTAAIDSIPGYAQGNTLPIFLFLALALLSQLVAVSLVALAVLALSRWRKTQLQALFFSLLFLAFPLALSLMGLTFTKWCSVYPLYAWPSFLWNG